MFLEYSLTHKMSPKVRLILQNTKHFIEIRNPKGQISRFLQQNVAYSLIFFMIYISTNYAFSLVDCLPGEVPGVRLGEVPMCCVAGDSPMKCATGDEPGVLTGGDPFDSDLRELIIYFS